MHNRKKTKRYNFSFDPEIDFLLKKIKNDTMINFTRIVEESIIDFAIKKGVINGR